MGASLHRIGSRARCPSRAGLGGFLLECLRPCLHHEGGAWAPPGGVLRGTFPSGEHRARGTHHSGVHHQDHSRTARRKSHARRQPLTRRSSPSRRGCWAACLHRRPRAQQGRISGAFLAFTCGPLRGPAAQLRSHALRLAEHGVGLLAQHAACPGSSGGQVPRRPGGDGDGLQGTSRAPRASRGSGSRWLMRSRFFNARLQLHQLYFIYRTR